MIPEIFYFIYLEENVVSRRKFASSRCRRAFVICRRALAKTSPRSRYGLRESREIFIPPYRSINIYLGLFKQHGAKFEYLYAFGRNTLFICMIMQ